MCTAVAGPVAALALLCVRMPCLPFSLPCPRLEPREWVNLVFGPDRCLLASSLPHNLLCECLCHVTVDLTWALSAVLCICGDVEHCVDNASIPYVVSVFI